MATLAMDIRIRKINRISPQATINDLFLFSLTSGAERCDSSLQNRKKKKGR